MTILFFETPVAFREWLDANHATSQEQWVGYYKKDSGLPSITWPESVDQALCYGWIDGLRKSIDQRSYKIRFTPRKLTSIWSKVNLQRVEELTAEGRMQPAGLQIHAARREGKQGIYAYEQREAAELNAIELQLFQHHASAWEYFQSQPAGYRNTALYWVISAKQAQTREKRLATLIADSATGQRIGQLRRE